MSFIMKKKILAVLLVLGAFTAPVIFASCAAMGKIPSTEEQISFKDSPQFFPEREEFDNVVPHLQDSVRKQISITSFIWKDLWSKRQIPSKLLPQIKPNIKEFMAPSEAIKSIWLGHSSFLLNVDGKAILLDPVFGEEASPVFFAVNRFQDPVLALEELPKIDFIVISHDHYDHLDIETVQFFKDENTQFITPLGVGSHLREWGIKDSQIHEKDWWQVLEIDSLKFTAAPSQHFSGRSLKSNRTLWASWVIQSKTQKIYFSGDTGYSPHFKEIGKRLGPFDFAYIECGQYNEAWRQIHLLPDEIVKAFHDLDVKLAQPIHWGMFDLSINTWDQSIEAIYSRHLEGQINIAAPMMGQTLIIGENPPLKTWWRGID
jgi:L-ascorbate metabolism protein UlaG (beta-lactamase superfamily)